LVRSTVALSIFSSLTFFSSEGLTGANGLTTVSTFAVGLTTMLVDPYALKNYHPICLYS
jgi:hypothetical protein